MKRLTESPRLVAGFGLVALLAYVLWIGGPYLRSIIVRDAAVTTWINIDRPDRRLSRRQSAASG